MVFIRNCFITALCLFCMLCTQAQTVYYPASASSLLRSTASDVAALFQKAISGSHFTTQSYTALPADGIILLYDTSIADNQACKVVSSGNKAIKFTASQDNGLNFGVYEYLQNVGFRFYQPGDIWEIIPTLFTPYKNIDTIYTCRYNYKSWFISGGHNRWVMDNSNENAWDIYFGENGHQWALYQRRNNMLGASRFAGHQDEIMTGNYLAILQNNPCYVAPYNGSRKASTQSVPDINNIAAMQLWANAIEKKYSQFKNTVLGNEALYPDYNRNFNYNYNRIGIEVPDGAHWANSKDSYGCGNFALLSESDQQFTLGNYTAAVIGSNNPGRRFQLYAYDGHAAPPSSSISINKNIDVQVVATSFQLETSAKGLLNRWYSREDNISEYHYLNLPQWSGETPSFFLDDLKNTIQRIKEKNSQGIILEASPAKFASLPFLFAANASLKNNFSIDSSLLEFCDKLFGAASATIYNLIQLWGSDKSVMLNNGIQDNKYKVPYYLQIVQQAALETKDAAPVVKERIAELKAYLHYMILYYDLAFDQQNIHKKSGKAALLCNYLAKINKLKIVNSYYLITGIVNQFANTDPFYIEYNPGNGKAYQNGNLPLITATEIENNFTSDVNKHSSHIQQYNLEDAATIKNELSVNNLVTLDTIKVKINYTYAKDYSSRSEFFIIANQAGNFTLQYTPTFELQESGYLNFTVEATDKILGIIKDFSIHQNEGAGLLNITLPEAGTYKLTVSTKYKTTVDLLITTNGNYFYKNGPYLGNTIENYRADLVSLPGFFHLPLGVSKIYFTLNNSNPGGNGFATPEEINKIFLFKDNNGNAAIPKLVTASDSALFYLDVPTGASGSFWQVTKMEQYRLCFANISNVQWYARRKSCTGVIIKLNILNENGLCITQLQTNANSSGLHWKVEDGGKLLFYNNQQTVKLPGNISPNAVITLSGNDNCSTTKRARDDAGYMQQVRACTSGGVFPITLINVFVFPNPGSGIFKCSINGQNIIAEDITIYNNAGLRMAHFTNSSRFNIGHLPGGLYIYQLLIKNTLYKGKLVKL